MVLTALMQQQAELEDLFRLEASEEDIKNDKLAKDTYRYLKRRRRLINKFKKDLAIEDTEYKRGQKLHELCEYYIFGL